LTAFDLLIRASTGRDDVGVLDGQIAAVAPELGGGAREEIDARGLELLPGVVDAHVHRIEPGADADLVLVDYTTSYELQARDLHQRHPISPFVGRTLRARVVRTLLRGQTVFADGQPVGEPAGRLLRPEPRA
jgi:dihydroorotase-like cyclic amidohydrolase